VLDSSAGAEIVSDAARRVASFDWSGVDHDVLKVLYQSVIAPDVRKRLGEYYTPDWLAELMIDEVIDDPANERVLDPACGSGTFLFHAVRRYLDSALGAGVPAARALEGVTNSVFGMDLHPVAVALAQTTYLMAIGPERLAQRTHVVSIPVYLGDSMRWESAEDIALTLSGDVVLSTAEQSQAQLFGSEIRFPAAVVANVRGFDDLVNDLTRRASNREPRSARPSIAGVLNRAGVAEEDRAVVQATYNVLCDLRDDDRDHVWGYYVRNQSRPTWLARPENRVDALIGNPPWLAYRYMSPLMQTVFERRARERRLWLGGGRGRTTQQDLSAFFVARAVELYLRPGGHFGFVMPRAVLSRQTYVGFRGGNYTGVSDQCYVAFAVPWDLKDVRPDPFPVPSSVVFGERAPVPGPMNTAAVIAWSGRAPQHSGDPGTLECSDGTVEIVTGDESGSPYKSRFRQGAILVPRMLIMVTDAPDSPLGLRVGRHAVRSRKSALDKKPWKELPEHEGVVESIFVRPAYLGESIAPFRVLSVPEAVIPYDGTRLMDGTDDRIDRYPGLAEWWRGAESIWLANRSSEKRTLIGQLDYIHQLSSQFPISPWRVVYTKAGNTLAASAIHDLTAVIDHKLYWAAAQSSDEAAYLAADRRCRGDQARPSSRPRGLADGVRAGRTGTRPPRTDPVRTARVQPRQPSRADAEAHTAHAYWRRRKLGQPL
jgi:SAM-dependent methyltransferase